MRIIKTRDGRKVFVPYNYDLSTYQIDFIKDVGIPLVTKEFVEQLYKTYKGICSTKIKKSEIKKYRNALMRQGDRNLKKI